MTGAWASRVPISAVTRSGASWAEPVWIVRLLCIGSAIAYALLPLFSEQPGTPSTGHDPTIGLMLLVHAVFLGASSTAWFRRHIYLLNTTLIVVIGHHLLWLCWERQVPSTLLGGLLTFSTLVAATLPLNFRTIGRLAGFQVWMVAGALWLAGVVEGAGDRPLVLVVTMATISAVSIGAWWIYAGARHAPEEAAEPHPALDPLMDTITALPKRRTFQRTLAERLEGPGDLALLLIDLDRFGRVNEALGHVLGNQVLAAVALAVQSCLRPTDLLARVGGDEFAVVLEGAPDRALVNRIAQRIQTTLEAGLEVAGQTVFCSASVGATLRVEDVQAEVLLGEAHAALLTAKRLGPGGCVVGDPALHARAADESKLEQELWGALERGELCVHYQPIVRLDESPTLSGFEALVRWQHPSRGLLLPGAFIELAEVTGLVVPLGAAVLREAVRGAVRLREVHGDVSVAVNVSARQLAQPDFVELVSRELALADLHPSALRLEVVEGVLLEPDAPAVERLATLREAGVHIHIDDFGTGYSSLAYLQRLPIDAIKIDRSFVKRGPEDSRVMELIRSLARSMGVELVAEGVETLQQLDVVRQLGCDTGQGWLFGRALPMEAALKTDLLSGVGAVG